MDLKFLQQLTALKVSAAAYCNGFESIIALYTSVLPVLMLS